MAASKPTFLVRLLHSHYFLILVGFSDNAIHEIINCLQINIFRQWVLLGIVITVSPLVVLDV
jgi:hypothetical protein